MFDNYLFVQYDYAQRSGEEGQMPHRKVRNVFPVERAELHYIDATDPNVVCVFHRDERMTGEPDDPCPRCQTPMQAVAYRFNRGKLVIYVVEGELAVTNPLLDIESATAQPPVEQAAPVKPKRSRSKPRAKSPVPVAEEAASYPVLTETG